MANEVAVTGKKELITQIGDKLQGMIAEQAGAFPKDFNETRFLQNCLAVLADTKDIEKCKPMSVVRTMIKGAYLGLDFFRRECYAIPYGEVLTFQTDYKGEIKLAKKYGKNISDIYAKIVQEGDVLEIGVQSGRQVLNFTPKAFNDGKIIGVFAVVVFNDGTTKYETMSVKDVEEVRQKYSKAPNSPAWQKSWGEMGKKVVLRRLCKLIDLDFDNQEQQKAYEEGGDADIGHKPAPVAEKVDDPFLKAAEAPQHTEAEIVDTKEEKFKSVDQILFNEIKKAHETEEDWQIEVRVKERLGVE